MSFGWAPPSKSTKQTDDDKPEPPCVAIDQAAETIWDYEVRECQRADRRANECRCRACREAARRWHDWVDG